LRSWRINKNFFKKIRFTVKSGNIQKVFPLLPILGAAHKDMSESKNYAVKITVVLFVTLFLLGLIGTVASQNLATWRYSRHMKCGEQTNDRMRELCTSIERNLEYTCCGHAIVSPGYRSTLKTVAAVWCEQRVRQEDLSALIALSKSEDVRLGSTAESLLRLLTGYDQYGTPEADVSVLNPLHPSYLLKEGCQGQRQ
jgi:hypothetical protein